MPTEPAPAPAGGSPGGRSRLAAAGAAATALPGGDKLTSAQLAEIDKLCGGCLPGFDGALNRPVFNAPGAPYHEPISTEKLFARGSGGGFKAGKPKIRSQHMPKAVHGGEVSCWHRCHRIAISRSVPATMAAALCTRARHSAVVVPCARVPHSFVHPVITGAWSD